jgi:hypothetical protein
VGYPWAGNDINAGEEASADFWLNGVEVWQDAKVGEKL